jgi:histidinol dehydrogenase
MPCLTISYASPADWPALRDRLAPRRNPGESVESRVLDILAQVRERGDDALVEYTRRFDCPDFDLSRLAVPLAAIETAPAAIPPRDLDILREAIARIRAYHANQAERSWVTTEPDGTVLGQLVRPVDRVGLYVPGGQAGTTPLISSLIMNAVPAQVAGVQGIAVVSPPTREGGLNPYLLATANLLGLTELFCCGSAWAIAALAHGTASIQPCDVLAGPGNIFVTTAKRLLVGLVGIDMIAGPSEIAILADDSAKPEWLAADMLSQAEHDPLASAVLITDSARVAEGTLAALKVQTAALPRSEIAAKALAEYGAVVRTPDLAAGTELVNRLAPEHLELALADPWAVLGRIRHAGAIFMGHHCPEPVGDYFAGPNHVLPTLGTARFSSALSVQAFQKKSSLIATPPGYIREHGEKIARLARLEGLEAHARSVEQRIK